MILSGRPSFLDWTTRLPRASHLGPQTLAVPRAARPHPRLVPHAARLPPWPRSIRLSIVGNLELRASVKICVNEHPLGAASRWAHVATVYFMRFRCMLHMFIWMLQSRSDVAYVAMTIHVCCKCFIWMLHWLYTCVASVCFKCFSCFKRMLRVFYLYVAYVAVVIHIGCKCFICFEHILQQMLYITSVPWACAERKRWQRWSPRAQRSPHARQPPRACVSGLCIRSIECTSTWDMHTHGTGTGTGTMSNVRGAGGAGPACAIAAAARG
jgi:hypothetical protein